MIRKISDVLIPQEFTRVDGIIDLVFSAAEDAREATEVGEDMRGEGAAVPVSFNDACAERIRTFLNRPLVKQSRTIYSTADGLLSVVCAASRAYEEGGAIAYWYAFHPHQREKIAGADESYVAFGCGSEKIILLVPFKEFQAWLDGLNVTQRGHRFYWHVSIFQEGKRFELRRKRGFERVDLTRYLMKDRP